MTEVRNLTSSRCKKSIKHTLTTANKDRWEVVSGQIALGAGSSREGFHNSSVVVSRLRSLSLVSTSHIPLVSSYRCCCWCRSHSSASASAASEVGHAKGIFLVLCSPPKRSRLTRLYSILFIPTTCNHLCCITTSIVNRPRRSDSGSGSKSSTVSTLARCSFNVPETQGRWWAAGESDFTTYHLRACTRPPA